MEETDKTTHGVIALTWCKPLCRWVYVKNHNNKLSFPWTFRGTDETCEKSVNRLFKKELGMTQEPWSKRYVTSTTTRNGYYFACYIVNCNTHMIQFSPQFKLVYFASFSEIKEIAFGQNSKYPLELTSIILNKEPLYVKLKTASNEKRTI